MPEGVCAGGSTSGSDRSIAMASEAPVAVGPSFDRLGLAVEALAHAVTSARDRPLLLVPPRVPPLGPALLLATLASCSRAAPTATPLPPPVPATPAASSSALAAEPDEPITPADEKSALHA